MRYLRVSALVVLIFGLGASLRAQNLTVCFEDQASLTTPAMGSFYREFSQLVGPRGIGVNDLGDCEAATIRVVLARHNPRHPAGVLGAVRVVHGTVLPEMEVYLDPVLELLPSTQCWSVIGRALARVAAHEVAHFVNQTSIHDEIGLLQQDFSPQQLAAEDSYPFRWIRASR